MPSNLPHFTLRVSLILLQKMHYIAACHARSTNREIELLIRKYVEEYERTHGEIYLDEQAQKRGL